MNQFSVLERNTFFADPISVLEVTRNRGYEAANNRTGRAKHSFIYTESGRIRYRLSEDGAVMEAAAGEMVFLPKGTMHTSLYLENGTRVRIVQFDLRCGTLPPSLSAPRKVALHRGGELIDSFFAEARPHPLLFLSRLCELVYRIEREESRALIKFEKLQAALDEIHNNPYDGRRVAEYAALCDMSEPGFRRLFREYTGESPVDYRNSLRLERARILLESGDCNVSEAAETVGFANLSFFIRLYKKKYGHTPKNS